MFREIFKKYKIRAKKFYTIIALSLLEIVLLIWYFNWEFNAYVVIPLIQFVLMFEKRDIWAKLTEKEKEELLLSEVDIYNFIEGVKKLTKKNKTTKEIVDEIIKN